MNRVFKVKVVGVTVIFLLQLISSFAYSQQVHYSDFEEIENVAAVNGVPSNPGQGVERGDTIYSKIGLSLKPNAPDLFFIFHAIRNEETDEILAFSMNSIGTHNPGIQSTLISEVSHTVEDYTVKFNTTCYVTSTNTVFRQIGAAIYYLRTWHHRWN